VGERFGTQATRSAARDRPVEARGKVLLACVAPAYVALASALGDRLRRFARWCEGHPLAAWLLLVTVVWLGVGPQATWWARSDYPGAWFHTPSRHQFDDLGVVMARAGEATDADLAGYWFSAQIDHVGWYRPLPSTLWVVQYRLLGADHRKWNLVSLGIYMTMCAALAWMMGGFWHGPRWQRMAVGLAAVLLFGAPSVADHPLHWWMLTWWPAQPDLLSLLFGALLLGSAARYAAAGRRRWAYAAPVFFFLAVISKEIAYVAGLAACLALLPHRRCWPLLALLALEGLGLFAYRHWALQGFQAGRWTADAGEAFRLRLALQNWLEQTWAILSLQMPPAAAATSVWLVLRRRTAWASGMGAAAYLGVGWLTLDREVLLNVLLTLGKLAWILVLVLGALKLGVRSGFPALLGAAVLSWLIGERYPPVFGWYRLWGTALGAMSAGVCAAAFLEATAPAAVGMAARWRSAASAAAGESGGGGSGHELAAQTAG
jgi:hypothetical protein